MTPATGNDVLQKLLLPWQSHDALGNGSAQLGGAVVRASDAAILRTAGDLLAAYGIGADRVPEATHVDVLRFSLQPLMSLSRPPAEEAPWPTYPTGFLRAPGLVPVWHLARTRCPRGTELWRVGADGEQRLVSVFDGAARGWRGAPAYAPPRALVGPRATWRGEEYAAELLDEAPGEVELVHVGEQVPEGFGPVRPLVAARRVPRDECDVFERVVTAVWRSLTCRVLDRDATSARILLEHPPADAAARPGVGEVEPGLFEATVALEELEALSGRESHLVTDADPAGR